jgi:ABC-type transport system involved in multi-copper enzyme maturation permease subunit
MRSFLSIVAGYLVFSITAVLLFRISGVDPHHSPAIEFIIGSIVYGVFFAGLGGYVSATIAKRKELAHALVVAGIIAVIAIVSLILAPKEGILWSELATLLLMAPAAWIGGYLRTRQASGLKDEGREVA